MTMGGSWYRDKRALASKAGGMLFVVLALVASPALGDNRVTDGDFTKFDIHLQQQLASAEKKDVLTVFVLAGDVATAKRAVEASGMRLADTFDKVGTAVAEGTPSQIRRASRFPGVDHIEFNRPIKLMLDTALKATRSEDAYKGFTQGSQTSTGVDGSGISIAILDTGIDGTHPFFQEEGKSKVVKNMKLLCPFFFACMGEEGDANEDVFLDLTNSTNDTDSGSAGGHGTHVAGIAAGVPVIVDGKAIQGAAPGAKLVGISVGQGLNVYGGFAGLNWVLEHHAAPCGSGVSVADCPPIKVINNSYGGAGEWNPDGVDARLQTALLAAGVNVIWSAGNGDELNDGGDGSDNRVGDDAQHPGPGIISVANYDDQGTGTRDGSLDSSSSRGESGRPETYPDISAPGTQILSSCRAHLISCKGFSSIGDYDTASGTSMSSPLVAGIVAQLRQAGPSLTPGQIENIIQDTAYKFTAGAPYEPDPQNPDGTTSFDKGAGLIDAKAAVARIRGIDIPVEQPLASVTCQPGARLITDPEDDATTLYLSGATANEPTLDLTGGSLRWDAEKQEVVFTVEVADLPETNPSSAPSISYNFNFNHDGEHLYVEASRGAFGQERFLVGFFLGTPGLDPRFSLVDTGGSFDAANDKIEIVLPNEAMSEIGSKPFEPGDRISGLDIVSRRGVDAYLTTTGPNADIAEGNCPYVIADATGSLPELPEAPEPDVELTAVANRYEWRGERATNVEQEPFFGSDIFGCDGIDGPACQDTYILLGPATVTGKVTVTVTGDNPTINDFDVYIYGPDRKEVARSGEIDEEPGTEETSFEVKKAGVYTVSVHAWLTADAAFGASAQLAAPPGAVTSPPASTSSGTQPSPSPSASPSPEPRRGGDRTPERRQPESSPAAAAPSDDTAGPVATVEPDEPPAEVTSAGPAEPEVRTKGVSATASLAAAITALLAGLGAGFAIARRR